MSQTTDLTNAELAAQVVDAVGAVQDAEAVLVQGAKNLADHIADPNAHGTDVSSCINQAVADHNGNDAAHTGVLVPVSDPRLSDARTPKVHKATHMPGGNDALAPSDIGAVGTDDERLTNSRTPLAHKASHAEGGSDALSPADIGAVADDDARLTNPRTPLSHKASHATGGSDEIAPADIGAVALTDSRLSDARTPTAHVHDIEDVDGLGIATDTTIGLVKGDGTTTKIQSDGTIKVLASSGSTCTIPTITGENSAPIGIATSYSVSSQCGLQGGTVVGFDVTFNGVSSHIEASENSAIVQVTVPAGTAAGTEFTLEVIANDNFGGASKVGTKTITAVNASVKAPTLTAPTANAYVSPTSVTFSTSAFATVGSSDTHVASRFKITSDAAGETVLYDSGRNTTDKLTHTATLSTALTPGSTYYAFAQHEGATLGVSGWSAPVAVVASSVATPTITSPTANSSVNPTNVTITTSAFSCAGGVTDTHASTDWRITSDAEGNTVIAEALASTDLTSHVFAAPSVTRGQTYYLWARHRGASCGESSWVKVQVTIKTTRHGEIIYDTAGSPAAVIVGSYASNGAEPWNIRGKQVWLAVGLASKRGVSQSWAADSSTSTSSGSGYGTDITTIENPSRSSKLASDNSSADGSGDYVSTQSTEAHMDAAFAYSQTVKDSEGLTDAILAFKSNMQAAAFCRSISLADGLGTMDLPSIDALMRVYQARSVIDSLDPTASANTAKKLSAWGFGSVYGSRVWSASEYDSTDAWYVYSNGNTSNYYKSHQFGVCPVLEIPA